MKNNLDFDSKIDIKTYFDNISKKAPLVHCITNFVTVNDCANIVLACGGSPTMAHHEDETAEITSGCQALVLNMGNVSDAQAMINAGSISNELKHPIILDPVGVGASQLRRDIFKKLSDNMKFSVIRGNATEIKYLATGCGAVAGVDAAIEDRIDESSKESFAQMAMKLAKIFNCVVAISGELDIVASADKAFIVKNGCSIMSKITGTGCMLTAMIGAFAGANRKNILESTLAAVITMGVCGEIAEEKIQKSDGETMTFRLHMLDAVSMLIDESKRTKLINKIEKMANYTVIVK